MATTPFTLPPAPSALRLETPRLVLRLLEEADIPAMTAYRGDPEVCRFLPFDPQSADDIRAFVKERVANYKYPRQIWFPDELPKGPTGKILKREIKSPTEQGV